MQVPYIWGAPGNPINSRQERYNFIRDSTIIIRFRSYRSSHCSWPDSICELLLIHVFICDQSIWFSSIELSSRRFYLNKLESNLPLIVYHRMIQPFRLTMLPYVSIRQVKEVMVHAQHRISLRCPWQNQSLFLKGWNELGKTFSFYGGFRVRNT